MHILLFFLLGMLFFVILFVPVFLLGVLGKIFSLFGKRSEVRTKNDKGGSAYSSRKKIFSKDEGEYVDFEEVKK